MTTAVPILERGLTAVAINDYFKSEPRIAELDGTLAAGVDGDLLIDVIKDRGSPDAPALVLFFHGEAVNIGLLGKLAMTRARSGCLPGPFAGPPARLGSYQTRRPAE